MKAFSPDLRERILAAVLDEEQSQAEAARRFAVGESAVSALLARARAEGRAAALESRPRPGARPKLSAAGRTLLALHVSQERPDATLAEAQAFVLERLGVSLGVSRLSQVLGQLDLPRKKRVSPPRSATRRPARPGGRSARPRPWTPAGSSSSTSAASPAP